MREYPTHTWEWVVAEFRRLADDDATFAPMRAAVEWCAAPAAPHYRKPTQVTTGVR